ncbi:MULTISPECIES: universal stress protein [Sphingomonadales]|jgi:nucleotide-binding universal stress UspA family protein|uniref:Universal stress protein n=8 Tax=Sphingomonadales TaxID=204457 RepID=A0A2A4FX50_9SPHN|nr:MULTISPECIES: universal stress protein [Sphingomonadales]ARR57595.1 universal stress protein [Rhizorhabdus wittichii DC-6]ATE66109.1 universal stress protein [Rhizorhabdus dicambivorans]AZI37549.1 universal stress protein [Caenibius tardaugens NBRC 16725]PCE42033.1 universal stress protein [Rhizorhabdus dicambivorans]QUT05363.1 universal stress protein [Sphingobium phenoxybenzoativorans]
MTPRTILFPTDFSGRCDRARDRAIQLASEWRAHLVLLHVQRDPDPADMLDGLQAAESRLHARLRAEVADPDIPVETRLATGAVSQAVLEASTACGADLIVTGISRHDDIGDFLIGTTVERMIRHAHAPVLIVKEKTQHHYRRVLVATDFSGCSAQALRTAMAAFPAAEITLVHAYHVPLEALRGREGPAAALQARIAYDLDAFLDRTDLPADARDRLDINVDYGEVCEVVRNHVKLSETDLAVIGTHGRSALTVAVLGSTARALLSRLDCDVLLVRQQPQADAAV